MTRTTRWDKPTRSAYESLPPPTGVRPPTSRRSAPLLTSLSENGTSSSSPSGTHPPRSLTPEGRRLHRVPERSSISTTSGSRSGGGGPSSSSLAVPPPPPPPPPPSSSSSSHHSQHSHHSSRRETVQISRQRYLNRSALHPLPELPDGYGMDLNQTN